MFYTWIIWFLGLWKLIPLSAHTVMKKKKLGLLISFLFKNQTIMEQTQAIPFIVINIPHSTPQSSIMWIFDNNQHSLLINHLLLLFKFYIYSARNTKQLNFDHLKKTIKKIKELEVECLPGQLFALH